MARQPLNHLLEEIVEARRRGHAPRTVKRNLYIEEDLNARFNALVARLTHANGRPYKYIDAINEAIELWLAIRGRQD